LIPRKKKGMKDKTYKCPFCGSKMGKYLMSIYYHCKGLDRCALKDASLREDEVEKLIEAINVLKVNQEIKEGSRALVFDPRLYVDDVKTPFAKTMQPATILKRYMYRGDDVVDVQFDHDGRVSHAHFLYAVKPIRE
jgi:hypothetical protein